MTKYTWLNIAEENAARVADAMIIEREKREKRA